MAAKIELCGRLLGAPELRTTPGGTSLLTVVVDCGEAGDEMRLRVVLAGEDARIRFAGLKAGSEIRAEGKLRGLRGAIRGTGPYPGIEVVANTIEFAAASGITGRHG
ncbi:MAG: single-stranded DNA-binding protein [Candidatus Binataceae bacterium]